MRNVTPIDRFISGIDQAVRTVFGNPQVTERANPATDTPETELDETQSRHVAALMRINHTGEVCAQALYQGQALTAKLPKVRESMERAAQEENDHLDWCESRIRDLHSHTSYLNPIWYAGSFAMGAVAGAVGDKWSLGFVAETERQVVRHLDSHLAQLPEQDEKSRVILEQMKSDEQHHATIALEAGGAELPKPIKKAMATMSKVMTGMTYYI
ncbi:MAG TPA: 2-polyprenyl-3-methyl-6-methoxy-1,4-benzoquinone monooxygenase [Gammaproteobacteria bacterium]|nr:2-polyprenyl-3-methyl-6-methoxy-1,4-benzoquinone monooxygenase [Gammaproteobacteria bacterium]